MRTKLFLLPVLALSVGMLASCSDATGMVNSMADDLQSQINGMQSDIDSLKAQVSELKKQITALQGEMNAEIARVEADYKKKIDDAEAEVAALEKQIKDLTAQLVSDKAALETDYNSKINKVKTDYESELATLKANYDAQLAALEQDYKDRIDELKDEYDAHLETITANYDSQLATLVSNYDNQLANIKTDYNTKINNIQVAYETKVVEIEANLASANANIATLQSELSSQITAIQNDYNGKINDLTGRVATLEQVQTHTVTFNTNGGGYIASVVVIHGEKVGKPANPSKLGSNFMGWYYHDEPWYFYGSVVTEDMTLEAQWEQINYTATFQNDDGTVLQVINNVHYGDVVAYTGDNPIKPNQEAHYLYEFNGWDKELTVVGDMVFTAQYTKEYAPFEERYLDASGNVILTRYVKEDDAETILTFNQQEIVSDNGEVILEAEDAGLTGEAGIDIQTYYHGGKAVGWFNTGSTLTYSLTSSRSFETNLKFSLSLENGVGQKIDKYVRLFVNDQEVAIPDDLAFTTSCGWDIFDVFDFGKITFVNGENIIKLVSINAVNIDYAIIYANSFSIADYGVDTPSKPTQDGLKYSFHYWEETSNENNTIIYQPHFETATYGLEFDRYEVEIYHGSSKQVIVPEWWEGFTIQAIGMSAFAGTDVEEVSLPETIVEIRNQAFCHAESLNKINLPSSVEYLRSQCFDNTHSLEYVTFNEGIKNIDYRAFEGSGLKEVILPENISYIGDNAFGGLYADFIFVPGSTKTIEWNCFYSPEGENGKTNIIYTDREYRPSTWSLDWNLHSDVVWGYECMYEENGYRYAMAEIDGNKEAILVGLPDVVTNFEIPEKVNNVPITKLFVSFRGRNDLETAVLPDCCTEIRNYMFSECKSLTSVVMSNNVKRIGEHAFYKCKNLISVTFSNTLEVIDSHAFEACSSLAEINIPSSVTTIGGDAFNSTGIINAVLPDGLEYIAGGLFSMATTIKTVVIPKSVTEIRSYAFYCDYELEKVFYKGNQEEWSNIIIEDAEYSYLSNGPLAEVAVYYYSETEPATPGNYWHYVAGQPTVW